MKLRTLIPAAVALGAIALPAAASADTLLTATPKGSQNLTSGGGYQAWAQPNDPVRGGAGFKLVVRAPDGTVSDLDLPPFESPPEPKIGSDQQAASRNLLLVYSRNGDIYSYNLKGGFEKKVTEISSSAIETDPSINYGRYVFVRENGNAPGIYQWTAQGGVRRVSKTIPRELAYNGSRIAYPKGNRIFVQRTSGRGETFTVRTTAMPESLVLSRYRLSWLAGDDVYKTKRFGGSGTEVPAAGTDKGSRPVVANSIAEGQGDRIQYALDGEGLKRLNPLPFGSRG
jgi:hypothetical protein